MENTPDINEIKKDLYKSKAIAKLMYYDPANGELMYSIMVMGKERVFPIHTITIVTPSRTFTDPVNIINSYPLIKLTDDLKGARFEAEMKGSSLIRWIEQAIKANKFH